MSKVIKNYNRSANGKLNGYQEIKFGEKLLARGNCKNDLPIGYNEWHSNKQSIYHII